MKIESYNVRMDSASTKSVASTRTLRVGFTQGNVALKSLNDGSFSGAYNLLQNDNPDDSQTETDVSPKKESPLNIWERLSIGSGSEVANKLPADSHNTIRDIQTVQQQFVIYLWRMLFGESKAQKMQEKYGFTDMSVTSSNTPVISNQSPDMPGFMGNTITLYGINESYYREEQSCSFSSNGTVTTADGRTLDFSLDISMSSSFEKYYREQSQDVLRMCDPLVLNFDGDVADLSDQKFFFDLDADGVEEEISMLENQNGFLAYDSNNDGIINNGSELFGTKSGNGFDDLAAYDSDQNGWIDENDDIFDKLKIWTKTADGKDELLSLKDKNIGAIYLGNSSTDFTLRDSFGQTTGAIRRSGFFLYENGLAGTMAHLDIAN